MDETDTIKINLNHQSHPIRRPPPPLPFFQRGGGGKISFKNDWIQLSFNTFSLLLENGL